MTTEQLYEMMEQGNLGYACVFKKEDHGKHTDFLFPMTPENIVPHRTKHVDGNEIAKSLLVFGIAFPPWLWHCVVLKGGEKSG